MFYFSEYQIASSVRGQGNDLSVCKVKLKSMYNLFSTRIKNSF